MWSSDPNVFLVNQPSRVYNIQHLHLKINNNSLPYTTYYHVGLDQLFTTDLYVWYVGCVVALLVFRRSVFVVMFKFHQFHISEVFYY